MHFMRDLDEQLPYPSFVPGQGPGKRVFKEPVKRDVRTAHEVDAAVEVGSLGCSIGAEFPHAEAGRSCVARRAGFEHIKVWGFWRPQTCSWHRHRLKYSFRLTRSERDTLGFRKYHGDIGLPGVNSLSKVERNRFLSEIVQGCLHDDGTVCDSWRYLDALDRGVITHRDRNAVVNS